MPFNQPASFVSCEVTLFKSQAPACCDPVREKGKSSSLVIQYFTQSGRADARAQMQGGRLGTLSDCWESRIQKEHLPRLVRKETAFG